MTVNSKIHRSWTESATFILTRQKQCFFSVSYSTFVVWQTEKNSLIFHNSSFQVFVLFSSLNYQEWTRVQANDVFKLKSGLTSHINNKKTGEPGRAWNMTAWLLINDDCCARGDRPTWMRADSYVDLLLFQFSLHLTKCQGDSESSLWAETSPLGCCFCSLRPAVWAWAHTLKYARTTRRCSRAPAWKNKKRF